MPTNSDKSKSLIDEIYDEFIKSLKDSGELDADFFEKFTPFVKKGDLRKPQLVTKLLKDSVGKEK